MAPGPYEQVLDTLGDLDARLAGLQVSYSESNATAAQEHVAALGEFFEHEPEEFAALREAVDSMVESEDSSHAAAAKEHADALEQQIQAQVEEQ